MAKQEEQKGLLTSVVITNDGRRDSFIKLTILKEIFSQQLPKMPKDYITRLVFDRYRMLARVSATETPALQCRLVMAVLPWHYVVLVLKV